MNSSHATITIDDNGNVENIVGQDSINTRTWRDVDFSNVTPTKIQVSVNVVGTQASICGIKNTDTGEWLVEYESRTALTLTDANTYDADGNDMGQSISETFTAGQTVTGKNTTNTYGADTPAFSTTLYTGNGAARGIDTGVDNTVKSLVWFKVRDNTESHALFDTERGVFNYLKSDTTDNQYSTSNSLSAFNSDGFSLSGGFTNANQSSKNYVAWNFRAAPGFMDIQTWDGAGGSGGDPLTTHNHDLGTAPAFIITKDTTLPNQWNCYHKELGLDHSIMLNQNNGASGGDSTRWGSTDTTFSVSPGITGDASGSTYIAYLFADTPGRIKCGGYPGSGTNYDEVVCGFKPQWVMIKNIDLSGTKSIWSISDNKRGTDNISNIGKILMANDARAELADANITITDNGFIPNGGEEHGKEGYNYIYVAIAEDAMAGGFAPSGTLTADADPNGPTITLTDVKGTWETGMKVVNDTEASKEAPGADNIVFTSSVPDTTEGTVTSWGNADWELSTSSDFSTDLQERSVSLTDSGVQQGPNFNLADGTNYYVRTKYNSSDPVEVSAVSDANHFKTAAAAGPDIKDKFSTTLYTGNGQTALTSQTITTGIDNSGKCLLWFKDRTAEKSNILQSNNVSGLGGGKFLQSNATDRVQGFGEPTIFLNTGVTISGSSSYNFPGNELVLWNFKAAPGFMDIVQYTGNRPTNVDTEQIIPHSLQSTPQFIIVKSLGIIEDWHCHHADLGFSKYMKLNVSAGAYDNVDVIKAADDSSFTVGISSGTNELNVDYIAYLFADTPGLIKCGSFTGISGDVTVDVGFKPGWVLYKYVDGTQDWVIFDNARGANSLKPNTNGPETSSSSFQFTDQGFTNSFSAGEYIYVAIADPTTTAYYDEVNSRQVSQHELVRRFGVDADTTNLRNQGIYPLVNQPTGMTDAFVKEGDVYRAIPNRSMDVFHAQQEAAAANERLDDANEKLQKIQSDFEARLTKLEGKQPKTKK
jgi:hypothetical protein